MLIDMHAKSNFSPGTSISVDDVLRRAQEQGLQGVAFCDTECSAHCVEVLDIAAKYADLAVFIGVEIATDKGLLIGFVPEVDDFYIGEEWRRLTEMTTPSAEAVVDMFESRGGAVIAARPYDLKVPFNMGDFIFGLDRIQAIEVYNPRVDALKNNFALEAAAFMGLSTTGGSDPENELDSVGLCATFFEREVKTQKQLVDALRESEFWAVSLGSPEQLSAKTSSDSEKQTRRNSRSSSSQRSEQRRRPRGSSRRRQRRSN